MKTEMNMQKAQVLVDKALANLREQFARSEMSYEEFSKHFDNVAGIANQYGCKVS